MLKRLIILTATIATALCATAQNDRLADTDRNLERAAIKADLERLAADSARREREDARALQVDAMFEKRRVPPSGDR